MKIVVEIDLEHGRGSIRWKRASWRRVWVLCVAVGGLLIPGNLMADRLEPSITKTNAHIAKH